MERYTVIRIDEDVDFGCEERSADSPVMAVVLLEDAAGHRITTRQVDQMLYDCNIDRGDAVYLDEKQVLHRIEEEG